MQLMMEKIKALNLSMTFGKRKLSARQSSYFDSYFQNTCIYESQSVMYILQDFS